MNDTVELATALDLSADEDKALQGAYPILAKTLKALLDAGLQALARDPARQQAARERALAGWPCSVTVLSRDDQAGIRVSVWQHDPADAEHAVELLCFELGREGGTQPARRIEPGALN